MSASIQPTSDQHKGMVWWNSLSPSARHYWLQRASVGGRLWDVSPAEAWDEFKLTRNDERIQP